MTFRHQKIGDIHLAIREIPVVDPVSEIPVIFLHDSLGCISVWKNFPDQFAEAFGRNLLIYDRQGYGQSDPFSTQKRTNLYLEEQADFLAEMLTELKVQKAILFGHSDGGSIALIAAAKYPALIEAVITEGAHVFVEEVTLDGIRQAKNLIRTTDLEKRLHKHHGIKTNSIIEAWTETWLNPTFRLWNIEHFLPRIECPVLVMQGVTDEYGSEAQVDAIVNQVSGFAMKAMIPNAGHTPHKENTSACFESLKRFMMNTELYPVNT